VSTNAMTGKSLVQLQNIQNCHNMMKSGWQKDILERTTVALPNPERTTVRDHDDKTQKELDNHIEMCLMELVADMDEDDALQQSDAPCYWTIFERLVETIAVTKASPQTWWTRVRVSSKCTCQLRAKLARKEMIVPMMSIHQKIYRRIAGQPKPT
jgi:hypothetical protein